MLRRDWSCSNIPLLLLMATGGCVLGGSYYADSPADALAVTFNCADRWCNETWKGNRILRYSLTANYELQAGSETYTGPRLNCEGGQLSTDCVVEGSGAAEPLVEVINRTLVSVEDLGAEGIIATDNLNMSMGELVGTYRGSQDKLWQIRIPQDCQLWMVFQEFDLEVSDRCTKDYFSVQMSKNQPDIRRYCGSLESITIQRRRRVQLWFHADDSVERRGIFARYCFRSLPLNTSSQARLMCDCNLGGSHTRGRRRRRAIPENGKRSKTRLIHPSPLTQGY